MFNLIQFDNTINKDQYDILESYNKDDRELAMSYIKYKLSISNDKQNNSKQHRNDYMYKKISKQNAGNKCQITGIIGNACEVAHIYPYSKCSNDLEKYDPYNSIFIASTIHKLFDNTQYINIDYENDDAYMIINTHNIHDNNIISSVRKILGITGNNNKVKINNMSKHSYNYIKKRAELCK